MLLTSTRWRKRLGVCGGWVVSGVVARDDLSESRVDYGLDHLSALAYVCARACERKKCMHRVQVYECLFLLLLSYFEYLHADHCTSLSFISPRDFSANFTCYSLHLASWALHTVTAPWPALQKQNKNRGFQTALKNKSTDTRHCRKRPLHVLHL